MYTNTPKGVAREAQRYELTGVPRSTWYDLQNAGTGSQANPSGPGFCRLGGYFLSAAVVLLSWQPKPINRSMSPNREALKMNDDPANVYDMRPLTPAELSAIIKDLRQQRGWTQDQLAAISGRQERTIQRVEAGEPSDLDTRRALAGAFDLSDIDIFNKPWPIPNAQRLKAETERIERETVAVSIVKFTSGRQVRELAESGQASAFDSIIELPSEAEHVWAEMQDYFRDYGDVDDCCSAVQKLDVNKDFQRMIDDLKAHGLAVGGGVRRVKVASLLDATITPFPVSVTYLVIGPEKAFPASVRVPRKSQFA
jgi:transcriptional regulator with XRE-family HTH domain